MDDGRPDTMATDDASRIRVLLIAEQASPQAVSVPLVGWSHCQSLAPHVDGHIVTQIRHRADFEGAGLVHGTDFTAIDSERVAARLHAISKRIRGGRGKGWTTAMAMYLPSYLYFERLLWKQFGPAIRRGDYDLVHRVTPLSPTVPSPIAAKCRRAGVPFLVGPINGGVKWPKGFDAERRREREWLSYVRGAYRVVPGYGAMRRAASAIVCGSIDTWKLEPERARDKLVYVPENAIDGERFAVRRTRTASTPLRLVFVGRLVPYKGADMLFEAAAPLAAAGKVVIELVGDGPERPALEAQVDRLGIRDAVTFSGWMDHREVAGRLADSDLFVFPSIREFGGAVALEAMAVGLAPMVIRYGGLAETATDTTGFPIDIGPREAIVQGFRAGIEAVVADPAEADRRGRAALDRVNDYFTWERKAEQMLGIYRWVLGRAEKPDYGMPLGLFDGVAS